MAVQAQEGLAPAKPVFWNDPRFRALIYQVLVLGGVIAFGAYLVNNTIANMEARGISSGFGFLTKTAGFDIGQTLIEYNAESPYWRAMVVSIINTLLVSAFGILLATILGFLLGVARLSHNWLISRLAAVYIEIVRNLPLLLQIFFWYFAVLRSVPGPRQSLNAWDAFFLNNRGLYMPRPLFESGFSLVVIGFLAAVIGSLFLARWAKKRQMATGEQFPVFKATLGLILGLLLLAFLVTGFPLSWEYAELKGFNFAGGMRIQPEFVAMLIALSMYTAAFIGEIVRAGIMAVSHGQTEASYALGLRPGLNLRLVVIPQGLRVIVPPLTSQYLNLTKNSSLGAAIAYPEIVLVFAGTVLMQTGQAVEIIGLTMAFYLTVSLLISLLMNWYNKKIALVER